jgi:NAD(P)-dependent dehydrogenase (short-subunit alcohol dehydrogenase family)
MNKPLISNRTMVKSSRGISAVIAQGLTREDVCHTSVCPSQPQTNETVEVSAAEIIAIYVDNTSPNAAVTTVEQTIIKFGGINSLAINLSIDIKLLVDVFKLEGLDLHNHLEMSS